ncbi:hypothetical protein C2S51_021838 [Perilla frutescens var. frutescens]|nr:hypothetical protein C2S51_021838 [Perilla frutescens var. frutescens]
MAQNFVGILEHEGHREDFKVLTNQIRDHESTMRLKRRWLMDLPLSYKEQNYFLPMIMVRVDRIMPESFLREDDASFCGGRRVALMHIEDVLSIYPKLFCYLKHRLAMRTSGLVLRRHLELNESSIFVFKMMKILTGGLNKFDKTNWRMKRLVKELLPKLHSQYLMRSKSFRSITLRAMCRKLEGDRGYIPTLRTPEPTNEPAEQLAGALGVAGLTLKLVMNRPAIRDFRRFSPEMEALHNDIGKALHLLKEVSLPDLKEVLLLLDPEVKLSVKGSRPLVSVRNLLIEYLYECSKMDTVPGVLIEILGIINGRAQRRSRKKSSTSNVFSSSNESVKEEIEKEIEHVVNISAHAKEVVANLLPEHEFDEEFADAYMEDLEESDTLCVFDDDQRFAFRSCSSHDQTESTGEIDPVKFNLAQSKLTMPPNQKLTKESVESSNLWAVGNARKSVDEYFNKAGRVVNPSHIRNEINPRRNLLFGQDECGGILPRRPPAAKLRFFRLRFLPLTIWVVFEELGSVLD